MNELGLPKNSSAQRKRIIARPDMLGPSDYKPKPEKNPRVRFAVGENSDKPKKFPTHRQCDELNWAASKAMNGNTHPSKVFCMFSFTDNGATVLWEKVMPITQWFFIDTVCPESISKDCPQLLLLGEVKQETIVMMSGGELYNNLLINVNYGSKKLRKHYLSWGNRQSDIRIRARSVPPLYENDGSRDSLPLLTI